MIFCQVEKVWIEQVGGMVIVRLACRDSYEAQVLYEDVVDRLIRGEQVSVNLNLAEELA